MTLLCVAGVLAICSVSMTVVAAVFAIATGVAGLFSRSTQYSRSWAANDT